MVDPIKGISAPAAVAPSAASAPLEASTPLVNEALQPLFDRLVAQVREGVIGDSMQLASALIDGLTRLRFHGLDASATLALRTELEATLLPDPVFQARVARLWTAAQQG